MQEDFIEPLKTMRNECVEAMKSVLAKTPPGKKPDPRDIDLHDWYSNLSDIDKQYVERVVHVATNGAFFNFICMIEGESTLVKGQTGMSLTLIADGETYVVAGEGCPISDIHHEFYLWDGLEDAPPPNPTGGE